MVNTTTEKVLGVDRNCRSDIIGAVKGIIMEPLGVDRNCRSDIIDRVVNSVKNWTCEQFYDKDPAKTGAF